MEGDSSAENNNSHSDANQATNEVQMNEASANLRHIKVKSIDGSTFEITVDPSVRK